MPTLPTSPIPRIASPPGLVDPSFEFRVDQGYELRRSKYSRNWRAYTLEYLANAEDTHIILDFIERETRGAALSFDWDYPYPHAIASISTATPNVVTTSFRHGFQTDDQVTITGTSSHDGTYTIIRTSATAFSLNGTAGGSSEVIGSVAMHFPFMVFVFPDGRMPLPQPVFDMGPLADNEGLFSFTLNVEERFA